MESFQETGLSVNILSAIEKKGFEKPTPIQAKTIPHLLTEKRDLIALAQTGTGKTAAFGLPLVELTDVDDHSLQSLILCPTRELANQIAKDLTSYSLHTKGLKILAVYGGANIMQQIDALKRGVHVVVATPGRAVDLIKRKALKLEQIRYVVLDEADEMLNMGFRDDLDFILETTPEQRQTLLFSATMPREVQRIAQNYLRNPLEISSGEKNSGALNVEHEYYVVHAKDRYKALKRFVDVHPQIYAIIFCRTRSETKEVSARLIDDGYNAEALHGDLSQAQRDFVMEKFRGRTLQLLVATDVAARGLDVTDLTHVINYNLPDDLEAYIHRSGRTGRAGKNGVSIAIVHTRETGRIKELERSVKKTFTRKMVPTGEEICEKQLFSLIDKVQNIKVDEEQIGPYLDPIYEKLADFSREELIQHFVSAEFNRFLTYYKNAEDINVSSKPNSRDNVRAERPSRSRSGAPMVRLHVNVGKNSRLNPIALIGLINDHSSRRGIEIGEIDILKSFSFFNIEKGAENDVLKALNNVDFNGENLVVTLANNKPQIPSFRGGSDDRRSGGYSDSKRGGNSDGRRSNSDGRRNFERRGGAGQGSYSGKRRKG